MIPISLLLLAQTPGQVSAQELVDVSPPGSIVHLPVNSSLQPPLVVRKPLTLLGNARDAGYAGLVLEGPGAGDLVVWNLVHGQLAPPSHAPFVTGGGFETAAFYGCDIRGGIQLAPAGVQRLHLVGSHLSLDIGDAPIRAPGATVILLDSRIECPSASNVPTVDAAETYTAGMQIDGADWSRTVVHELVNDLQLEGSMRLGTPFTLTLSTPGRFAWLFWSGETTRPAPASTTAPGAWFLRSAELARITYSPAAVEYVVPLEPSLIGMRLAFQAIDPPGYVSRPCFALIR